MRIAQGHLSASFGTRLSLGKDIIGLTYGVLLESSAEVTRGVTSIDFVVEPSTIGAFLKNVTRDEFVRRLSMKARMNSRSTHF